MSDLISRKDLQDHLLHDWAFNFKRTEYKDRKGYRKRDNEVQTVIINMPEVPNDEEFIIKWLAEAFENPCNYGFNQQDIAEFMGENCPEWCDENCGKVSNFECWKKYFEVLRSKENER